jgi:hypothetical protein
MLEAKLLPSIRLKPAAFRDKAPLQDFKYPAQFLHLVLRSEAEEMPPLHVRRLAEAE